MDLISLNNFLLLSKRVWLYGYDNMIECRLSIVNSCPERQLSYSFKEVYYENVKAIQHAIEKHLLSSK